MIRRLAPMTAAAVLLLAALTGCSDDGGGGDESGDDAPSSPSVETSDPEEPYLPVPAGVELSPPGSDLTVGDSAMIAWQPRQNLIGVLDLGVSRLEQTSFKDSFEGWDVKAEQKQKLTPYFVRATVNNTGDTNLSGRMVPLYALDSSDTLVEATKFTEEFTPCPGGALPKGFAPGKDAEVCLVYLIAPGRQLTGVTFRPSEEFDPITWTGPVERLEKEKKPKKKNRGGNGNG